MEETNPTNVEQTSSPALEPTSPPAIEPSSSPALEPSSPLSPKNPMIYVGIGALIIIVLGLVFLFSKEKQPDTSPIEPTEAVSVEPTEIVSSDSTGVEIQEQTEAEAIQVSDADSDLQDISQDLEEL